MNNQSNNPLNSPNKDKDSTTDFKVLNPDFKDLKNLETWKQHLKEIRGLCDPSESQRKLLRIKTAQEWLNVAKSTPIPKMLFGEFWHENELCILFADTNLGKSILSVQIGNSISKGEPVGCFDLQFPKQQILYFDFELSSKQFELRYSQKTENSDFLNNHYDFDQNFKRVELDTEFSIPEDSNFEDELSLALEKSIARTEAKILIIDNITFLKNETEKASDALPLMKRLKALKSKYHLSILALAHTPKRDPSKPINRNDLQGSKMLMNFVDSCFAIGESYSDKHLRYLKQIKARNTEIVYDSENIAVFQIHKPSNFLEFEFLEFSQEYEHLKHVSREDRDQKINIVKELHEKGLTQRQIAAEVHLSVGAVNKYLKM